MELLYKFCYALTTLAGIVLGFFVLYKNPRSRVNVTWALTSFAVAIWALEAWGFFEPNYKSALLVWRITNYAALCIPVFFTHFCLALVNKPLKESTLGIAGYGFVVGMAGFFLTPWFIPSLSPKLIFPNYVNPGPLYIAFTFQFFILVFYSHWLLFRHLPGESRERQNQIRYVALGTIIGYACGSTTFLMVYDIPFNPLPSLFTALYAGFVTYAIVKHRLMDITIVIRKGLVYSILVALIAATYLVIVLLIERLLQGAIGYRSVAGTVVAAFVIALGFTPVRNAIQRWVDQVFFGGSEEALALENERLRQELTRSERLKAVALLASGLAHEVKNPLAAIKTFTDYLPEKQHDPEFLKKYQRIVSQELDKMQAIVTNLLTFAKPKPLQRTSVPLAELIQETLALLNGDCLKRRITIEVSADPLVHVRGDRTHLKQVLLNLCLNSLEAMEQGGTLRLSASRNGRHALLTVEDTGGGVASKDLPYVLDPFFTTKSTGTGLGLSVVHGIVKEHGGRIQNNSRPGQGTCVTVELPMVEGE